MSKRWSLRVAWGLALFSLVILLISAIMLYASPERSLVNWLDSLGRAVVGMGAPLLGLIIVTRQRRNRIGWLFLAYGFLLSFRAWGHAIYYFGGGQAAGYSVGEQFLLWMTEAANIPVIICEALLLLWFPDGQLTSRRWRLVYLLLFLGIPFVYFNLFIAGTDWNGGANAGGILIQNPYGWLPAAFADFPVGLPGFLLVVSGTILAATSLLFRYRSARYLVRLQLKWFVLGGLFFIGLAFLPAILLEQTGTEIGNNLIIYVLGSTATLPLYIAVGVAILRYRLYDIDLIIRRTLQYSILTALLALVYFGSVVILQSVVGLTASEQAPLTIVISTLLIAALFAPLRQRVQDFIDRRFFRQKYDSQQVLARFAQKAQDEVSLEALTAELSEVIQETIQPDGMELWLKQ